MAFTLAKTVEILERTPASLDALLRGTSPAWHRTDEGPGTWSAFDVVAHLIHADETNWVPRAEIILKNRDTRPFAPFDRFAHLARFSDSSLETLLDRFAEVRRENLETLRNWDLTEDRLSLPGRHPELGGVTLRQLLATWAVHDLAHIRQAVRVMARHYSSEVGPWREYLSILHQ